MSAIKGGWIPPAEYSEENYKHVKYNKDLYPPELVGFLGFGCSFGGQFFSGFAKGGNRNYVAETQRSLLKVKDKLQGIKFSNKSYDELEIPKNSLIYCDPPYSNTTGYSNTFNNKEFWEWVREESKRNIVLVSEYTAPKDFTCIWSKQVTSTLNRNGKLNKIEKLFKIF